MRELNRMLGIEAKLSTAFYLQTDGQTKHTNQELEQYLCHELTRPHRRVVQYVFGVRRHSEDSGSRE